MLAFERVKKCQLKLTFTTVMAAPRSSRGQALEAAIQKNMNISMR